MQSITIVLVGDEGLLLLEFEEALTAGGFDVVCFSSGAKAITYLASKGCRAEGVVTDIRLSDPSTNGWAVARIARNTATEMAVVYISGDSAAEWAINGVPNSMMLEKPFAMAEMITAVDQLLNDRSTGPASA
ncbi:response regulator [Sinorhizobium meliloti]|uniref:Response regulator n=1 Tax=Rhizobium meliloti TaxID=382 RepID=A0AAW9TT26_RHIML|nr:response regulator [Sinorhizobium meliloti]MDW9428174.1 response regulator [Sinorhizobium meliloti]MDX0011559.1 response regulator [Sinorhizobium meliloti]MDX0303534.1 response regulator [Sinorhizobium meliloti]MQV82551.1 response regulator [Sinorhizobium meliloti]MQW34437.1 response regulator [Sinorhizobium meliloti]